VQLVGPKGLRAMVRVQMMATATFTSFRWRVDELHREAGREEEDQRAGKPWRHFSETFSLQMHPCELPGVDVAPSAGPVQGLRQWSIPPTPVSTPASKDWTAVAAELAHGVMCVGYAFQEAHHAGKLDAQAAKARIETEENRMHHGVKSIKALARLFGELKAGKSVEVKEGGIVRHLQPEDVVSPPRPGRLVAVLGDSSDSRAMAPLCVCADLLVHEATNAPLGAENIAAVTAKTIEHGHSTPAMAGAFAAACGVRKLLLTHFSSRYGGDESNEEHVEVMRQVTKLARAEFGSAQEEDGEDGDDSRVAAAYDLLRVNVPANAAGEPRVEMIAEARQAAAEAAAAAAQRFAQLVASHDASS
jgi:ribonuclease Z